MQKSIKNLIICTVMFYIILNGNNLIVYGLSPDNFSKDNINTINNTLENFEITSGIDKDLEVTFDTNRTITGLCPKDSIITIKVMKLKSDKLQDVYTYTIEVGQSQVFSQDINLLLGDNYIYIEAKNKYATSKVYTTINRKKIEIKRELENGIVLPGAKATPLNLPF